MLPKGCFCLWKEKDCAFNYDDDGDDDDVNGDSDDGDGDVDDDVSVQDNLRVEEGRQSIMAWYQWSQSLSETLCDFLSNDHHDDGDEAFRGKSLWCGSIRVGERGVSYPEQHSRTFMKLLKASSPVGRKLISGRHFDLYHASAANTGTEKKAIGQSNCLTVWYKESLLYSYLDIIIISCSLWMNGRYCGYPHFPALV